ncbi:hypothetical protein CHS0354_029258 [Potamilus streckersoni]|uniref:Uncharacterized protein n=1 Tax=Potamilus streckersoni TaxID=2493646 RepID=A0AAE0W5C5_9BIVA|nr:hypothetical protein CHS0354_029258 [Potamilus streckersoni]
MDTDVIILELVVGSLLNFRIISYRSQQVHRYCIPLDFYNISVTAQPLKLEQTYRKKGNSSEIRSINTVGEVDVIISSASIAYMLMNFAEHNTPILRKEEFAQAFPFDESMLQ